MKKRIFRVLGAIFCLFLVVFIGLFCYVRFAPFAKIEQSKFVKNFFTVTFYNDEGERVNAKVNSAQAVDISSLPNYLKNAFIAVEDKRFYKHNGVDIKGVLRATKNNIFCKKIKEGGSTITQQLIKNTHLTSEKTLKRKIKEMQLALLLERKYTKEQILSYYLNGVYFGEGAYGIQSAANKYFGKNASELTLSESACLAATVKAPAIYNPTKERCFERKNLVLDLMQEQGYIAKSECESAKKQQITISKSYASDYFTSALEQSFELLKLSPYQQNQVEIFTYFNQTSQNALDNILNKDYQNGIILGKTGEIKGYKIPGGDQKLQIGSTIKPLLVYAPAIEQNKINLCTKILDEPCDFGGYTPKNYSDKYYGYVSAKDALSLSLNIPAVKILNSLDLQKVRLYARKLNIGQDFEGLGIALGGYKSESSLQNLATAYTIFLNGGKRFESSFIKQIKINGKSVYMRKCECEQVFNSGTVEIINYALKDCAKNGTAKAIGEKDYPVYAKTGTVGSQNGNLASYTVCYTGEDIIALRFNNKEQKLLPNEITGGSVARYAGAILDNVYSFLKPNDIKKSGEVEFVSLCLPSYLRGEIALACENQPQRYTFESPFLKEQIKHLKQSDFFNPVINFNLNYQNSTVKITLDKSEYVYFELWRESQNKKELIYHGNNNCVLDNLVADGKYKYYLVPIIYNSLNQKVYLPQIYIGEIKMDQNELIKGSDWWED